MVCVKYFAKALEKHNRLSFIFISSKTTRLLKKQLAKNLFHKKEAAWTKNYPIRPLGHHKDNNRQKKSNVYLVTQKIF